VEQLAGAVGDHACGHGHPADDAAFAHVALFILILGRVAGEEGLNQWRITLHIFRVGEIGDLHPHQFLCREAGDLAHACIYPNEAPVQPRENHSGRCLVESDAVQLLPVAQLLLGGTPGGDVADDAETPDDLPVRIAQDGDAGIDV